MAKIPVRLKRVAAAFDEVARARLCESSGSEHSPENSMDLFDLVKSFMERDYQEDKDMGEFNQEKEESTNETQSYCSDSEVMDTLRSLVGCEDDEVKRKLQEETEKAFRVVGNSSSPGFKRRLMTRLRERGFDAGLCKSKWEKVGRTPNGYYEYIDVNVAKTRYIVEVYMAGEFEIARASDGYASLLDLLPPIFVGKAEELKQVVRITCNAMRVSMKTMDMPTPPWRRFAYMQSKWFGSYKRTINETSARNTYDSEKEGSTRGRFVGFAPLPAVSLYCRGDSSGKVGLRVGQLTAAFNETSTLP